MFSSETEYEATQEANNRTRRAWTLQILSITAQPKAQGDPVHHFAIELGPDLSKSTAPWGIYMPYFDLQLLVFELHRSGDVGHVKITVCVSEC